MTDSLAHSSNISRHQLWPVPATGRRKGTYRLITQVDLQKKTGWAFEGSWLNADGRELDLPVGAVVVKKTPTGSVRSWSAEWNYALVPETGQPWEWSDSYNDKRFLSFRDAVAETLAGSNTTIQDPTREDA